jgi:hypothetical protein
MRGLHVLLIRFVLLNMTQILTECVHLLMSPAELQAVDDWSFVNRIRSRGEAVRRPIEMAIRPERDAPANTTDGTIRTIPGTRSGPYPWLAPELQNATKALKRPSAGQTEGADRLDHSPARRQWSIDVVAAVRR